MSVSENGHIVELVDSDELDALELPFWVMYEIITGKGAISEWFLYTDLELYDAGASIEDSQGIADMLLFDAMTWADSWFGEATLTLRACVTSPPEHVIRKKLRQACKNLGTWERIVGLYEAEMEKKRGATNDS